MQTFNGGRTGYEIIFLEGSTSKHAERWWGTGLNCCFRKGLDVGNLGQIQWFISHLCAIGRLKMLWLREVANLRGNTRVLEY